MVLIEDRTLAYCTNTLKPTYPEGLDVEVFRFDALKRAHGEAALSSDREHVTPYIWRHPELFKAVNFEHSEDLSGWRWTLDWPEDFQFILAVYHHFYKGHSYFPYREVIDYVRAHPDLLQINSGVARNEGYLASLEREQVLGSRNEDGL